MLFRKTVLNFCLCVGIISINTYKKIENNNYYFSWKNIIYYHIITFVKKKYHSLKIQKY